MLIGIVTVEPEGRRIWFEAVDWIPRDGVSAFLLLHALILMFSRMSGASLTMMIRRPAATFRMMANTMISKK